MLHSAPSTNFDSHEILIVHSENSPCHLQVKDDTITSSYLDKALFSDIVKYHHRSMGRHKTTVEWIVQGSNERENSATAVLDSLVQRGILGRESKLFGRRYPTLDSGEQILGSVNNVQTSLCTARLRSSRKKSFFS